MRRYVVALRLALVLVFVLAGLVEVCQAQDPPEKATKESVKESSDKPADAPESQPDQKKDDPNLAPLEIKLPKPAFKGTPKHIPPGTNLEKPRKGPRPKFMAPKGAKLVSAGQPVIASDNEPIVGEIKFVTDDDKSADEGSYVELGPGLQYVQIDLKKKVAIQAVLIWHYHANARVYHDVVVQVADDADFITNVRTLFSNDHDNSSGLGMGTSKEYWETYEGKLIDGQGSEARYIRLYSNGSTTDDQNHYVEVDVYATPAK
ncbi:MAG: hypothetical protein ABIG44_04710 [Planctomycetota bacterium]